MNGVGNQETVFERVRVLADDVPMTNSQPVKTHSTVDGIVLGRIVGLDAFELPLVDFPDNPSATPLPARTIATVQSSDVGQSVALMFEGGVLSQPIVMGIIRKPGRVAGLASKTAAPSAAAESKVTVQVDEEQLEFFADNQIVLRCGKAQHHSNSRW